MGGPNFDDQSNNGAGVIGSLNRELVEPDFAMTSGSNVRQAKQEAISAVTRLEDLPGTTNDEV